MRRIERLVGKTIQFWRKNIFGLTGEEFAEKLGVSKGYISKVESGYTGISLSKIEQIAKILKISPLTILSGLPVKESLDAILRIYRNPKYEVTIKELETLVNIRFRDKVIKEEHYLQILKMLRSSNSNLNSYRPKNEIDILLLDIEEEVNQ
ncbi:helix-turn-helix domain-containing protein [Deferribacter abyssi]|uniref:helix-turn-helix domain-containing protein n=1 Tax=Deferribacter abyssi TaxID=213806 RepID=UPI003C286FDF